MTAEHYVFGDLKVPLWAGDAMSNISYNSAGELIGATLLTANGVKAVKVGDVLMRINGTVILIHEKDANKYGIKTRR